MKRDMDLVREILFKVESRTGSNVGWELEIQGRDKDEIDEHVLILGDAGLLDVKEEAFRQVFTNRLTWAGHEFLEASRNPDTWNKVKKRIREKGVGMTFDLVKQLLMEFAKQAIQPS
jgi:hypothetical protein